MRKILMSLLCALLITGAAFAEVDIPQGQRVKNFTSGCCVWCSLENLANVHGINQLKGIAKYRHENYGQVKVWVEGSYMIDPWGRWVQIEGPHWSTTNEAPGSPERVHYELNRLKVRYRLQEHGDLRTGILREAVKKDLGCAVGLRDYPKQGDYHMVTLTDLDDETFVFVDNINGCKRCERSREWFNNHWTGYTILLYPNRD